jgi:hypothetical protein
MKRKLFFPDNHSMKEFIEEAEKISETPFNVISPKKIIESHEKYRDNK